MKIASLEKYETTLKTIPAPGGNGCHTHLMRVANYGAMACVDADTMIADIKSNMPEGTRTVDEREIRDTVEKANREYIQNTAPPASAFAQNALEIGAAQDNEIVSAASWLRIEPPPNDPLLQGVFDVGDKGVIIGPSKLRKSFTSLQLALCVATGRRFLKWLIPERRRVLIIQLELQKR